MPPDPRHVLDALLVALASFMALMVLLLALN